MKRYTVITILVAMILVICSANSAMAQSGPGGRGGFGGGISKSDDAVLQELIATYTTQFSQETYSDKETDLSITYDLFLPKDYDATQKYPAVVFIADSSCANGNPEKSLTQGYGAYVFAQESWQTEHPCIVLVPIYPVTILDDHGSYTTTEYVELTKRFVDFCMSNYSIDPDHVYGTGQSMGCMTSMLLESRYDYLYTACMFVDGQWESSELTDLADNTFVYFAAEGDDRAFAGMQEMIPIWEANGAVIRQAQWDATWTEDQISAAAGELFSQEGNIYCITWKKGTVLPANANAMMGEHMYSFDYAYKATPVLEWLFDK